MWNWFPQPSNFIKSIKILLLNGKKMTKMKQKAKERERVQSRRMERERKYDDKNL